LNGRVGRKKRREKEKEKERGERGEGVAESGEWVKGGIVATSRFKNGAWEIGLICCVNRETLVFSMAVWVLLFLFLL
jgi:hypothetical protein